MVRATHVRGNKRIRKPAMLRRSMATPSTGFRHTGLLATTALVSCLWGAAAHAQLAPGALPSQGQVVAGQSTISQSGNQMTINQASQRSAINWGGYNMQRGDRHLQPTERSGDLPTKYRR